MRSRGRSNIQRISSLKLQAKPVKKKAPRPESLPASERPEAAKPSEPKAKLRAVEEKKAEEEISSSFVIHTGQPKIAADEKGIADPLAPEIIFANLSSEELI